jgi:hypothetical protein
VILPSLVFPALGILGGAKSFSQLAISSTCIKNIIKSSFNLSMKQEVDEKTPRHSASHYKTLSITLKNKRLSTTLKNRTLGTALKNRTLNLTTLSIMLSSIMILDRY